MIANENWIAPKDYKVYCFNGKAEFVMVCVGREKDGHPQFFYFDRDWNLLPYSQDGLDYPDYKVQRPKCLSKLFEYADKLSKPFPFVRADFYICNSKVYFGELTFTPAAGLDSELESENLSEVNKMFGDLIDLHIVK